MSLRMVLAAALAAILTAGLLRSARAAEFHVDPSGDDAAPGDAAAPWRTVQHAVRQVAPGDTVFVRPGRYVESVRLEASGTAEAPIALVGQAGAILAAPAGLDSAEGIDVAAGVGHLRIDGFVVEGFAESILVRQGAHHVTVRGCEVRAGSVGVWIAGASSVVIDDCVLHDNRLGLRVSGAASDVVVQGTISTGNDDGLGCEGDADGFSVEETVTDVRFERCLARANGEDGFDLQGDRVVVAQSESRDNGCSGLKLSQAARVENTLAVGNVTGVATGSFFGAPVRIELVNNTVADNRGVQVLLRAHAVDPSTPSTVVLRNSVVAGAGKLLEVESPLVLEEDHNLFYRPDTTAGAIVLHRASGDERFSGQEINDGLWALATGQGMATLAVDPRFVDRDRYAVAPDSAAVDRGSAAAPAVDRSAGARPAGAAADIGVDEAPAASGNHAPWADPGPDRELMPGSRQRFLASGSVDPDGDALRYQWDFGDGSAPRSGYSVAHAWAAVGDYRLSLTVSDGILTHTRVATIRVRVAPPSPTPTSTALPTATPTDPVAATATEIPSAPPTDPPLATPTSSAAATVTESPPATATETPTATPADSPAATSTAVASRHDSTLHVNTGRARLRLTRTNPEGARRVRLTVGNADILPVPETPGHPIRIEVTLGTCPAALQIGPATFMPSRLGIANEITVEGGRQRHATVWLRVDPLALPPAGVDPLRCALSVRAVAPGDDPTPGDNVGVVDVEITDRRH
ncbi:MAG: PKD domain-containing protein [Candidatus Binatia bacterium]